jgi:uncharacterized protein
MNLVTFADLVHPSLSFNADNSIHKLILKLIDTKWFQRLRDISQTANTRLVYMFSEHSRFGHSLGVAYLADVVLQKLKDKAYDDVREHEAPVLLASLLHDIGHLAPGSHTAFKCWFPNQPDSHEALSIKILREDPEIGKLIETYDESVLDKTVAILNNSDEVPSWTWRLLSGGGWNIDRGNWCIADSILAGVSYGKYNIHALIDSLIIDEDKDISIRENRTDAMLHFSISRHAMYRQIYQHRVLLSADVLNQSIVKRARDIQKKNDTILPSHFFCDSIMKAALDAKTFSDLSLKTMFSMRESWWRYHLLAWTEGADPILADLSDRLLNRRLFKTVRVYNYHQLKDMLKTVSSIAQKLGFDPYYYISTVSTQDISSYDIKQQMKVRCEDGSTKRLSELDPLFASLNRISNKKWIVMPKEVKEEYLKEH